VSALAFAKKQGIEQGLKQGMKQAVKQAKENMLKTAKILLKKGMSVEDIIEATGLTKEEILKLND
jgi:predicted transposase/invertase (TIGR01784 family)